MAGTTITIAEVNTEMNAAITALRAGDYATAKVHAEIAEGMLAVKPDTKFVEEELIYDREAISRFVKDMERKARPQSTAYAITQIPVRSTSSRIGYDDLEY